MTSEEATRARAPAAPPRGGEACLVFVEGDAVLGRRVSLEEEVLLGRDPGCALPLPADDVSRRHARIVPQGDGHLLSDLGSTNGTWVNGRRIETHRLGAGDDVRIGPFLARYLAAGDPEGRHLEALAGLARRDPLTGLPNRRALEELLPRELARAARRGTPLALVALDADRFKLVNDAHGHAAGDAVLAAIAARAAGALRQGDLLSRIGGEEFAIVLPGADLPAAVEVAERIRAGVAGAPVAVGGRALAVTVSLGCAALLPGEDDPGALLARADERLYAAKAAGRNRVAS